MSDIPQICDYEGSNYRTDFWEGHGRDYEDQVERSVLRRWLPPKGKRVLEIGAGFGRLTNEFKGFQQVVVLDYSFSQLQYAREHYGDAGFVYVAADAYNLPFQVGVFDAATMIRVIHHFANVPLVLQGIRRTLAPRAMFILEYANKRNLKAMLRYALRQQDWNPYTLDPVEFVKLNFDFHPQYIEQALNQNGFHTQKRVPVSYLRLGLLKKTLPTSVLVALDSVLQKTGLLYSPSIFTLNQTDNSGTDQTALDDIFACPKTGAPLVRVGNLMVNEQAGVRYEIRDGIYIFKDLD
ncbi:MAG: hypothetical protein CUN56_04840 [Phototrophicales bacterium]|nr:MAG: hypothetical protein CUN56_04840 [Phototrophicales bacterium]RMG75965.1 MAG: methyltransferase domain-containing protein [Chloroflexota bacterium]